MAFRNVPLTAWPDSVTWATLFALAWARNVEYGIVTDGADIGAKIRYAFHRSRTTNTAIDTQPGIRKPPTLGPGPDPGAVGPLPVGDRGLGDGGMGAGGLGVLLGAAPGPLISGTG